MWYSTAFFPYLLPWPFYLIRSITFPSSSTSSSSHPFVLNLFPCSSGPSGPSVCFRLFYQGLCLTITINLGRTIFMVNSFFLKKIFHNLVTVSFILLSSKPSLIRLFIILDLLFVDFHIYSSINILRSYCKFLSVAVIISNINLHK